MIGSDRDKMSKREWEKKRDARWGSGESEVLTKTESKVRQ